MDWLIFGLLNCWNSELAEFDVWNWVSVYSLAKPIFLWDYRSTVCLWLNGELMVPLEWACLVGDHALAWYIFYCSQGLNLNPCMYWHRLGQLYKALCDSPACKVYSWIGWAPWDVYGWNFILAGWLWSIKRKRWSWTWVRVRPNRVFSFRMVHFAGPLFKSWAWVRVLPPLVFQLFILQLFDSMALITQSRWNSGHIIHNDPSHLAGLRWPPQCDLHCDAVQLNCYFPQ